MFFGTLSPCEKEQVQAGALLIQDRVHGIFKVSPPLGSHAVVGRDVDGVGGGVVFDSQTQICDGRRAVLLHQDVFGLQVSVSDGRFSWMDRQPRV